MGTAAGFGAGMSLFRGRSMRRFAVMFGLGMGTGLSYSQMKCLWYASRGTLNSSSTSSQEQLDRELKDIHMEMRLRSKLKLN